MPAYCNFNSSPAPFEFYPERLMYAGQGSVWWDFGDQDTLFQDISGTIPITASGQRVGLVLDKGPDGRHLFNTDVSRQPQFIISGAKKFLRFSNGRADYLTAGLNTKIALNGCYGFTYFQEFVNLQYRRILSVGKQGVVNDVNGTGTLCINTGSNGAWFNNRANAAAVDAYFSGSGASPAGLYEYSIRGANSAKVWKDSVQGVNDTTHPALDAKTDGVLCVGTMVANNDASISSPMDGDIYGIMHYANDLTPGEIGAIRTWWQSYRINP